MEFIPVNEPLLDGNEKKYVTECIDTGWISSEGPFVKKFENNMANYVERKYGIAVSNGSVALDLAVEALGLKAQDEVIMPAFTIISCAAPLVKRNIKPVLVDADRGTWNMDVSQIEKKITSKTRAIMVVHIYGLPVDMDKVIEIAKKYKLKIIEDAAEAHGLKYKGRMCGSFGDISIMSFYPNKHVTTGEGGMLLTDDSELAAKCCSLRNLCFLPTRRFVHEELGYNYRMSNIQAALGVAQLETIDRHLKRKQEIGKKYQTLLTCEDTLQLPLVKSAGAENLYWVFGMVLKEKKKTAQKIMMELEKKGIGCRPFFYPMHLQPVFGKLGLFENESYPVSEELGEYGFYVPSGLGITNEQIEYVCAQIKIVIKECN